MRFPWNRAESELEREIAHHLHELAAEYERQGHTREEALRLARREFGGTELTKDRCRDERRWAWITGLRQDIVFGVRMIRRTPVVTAAAVLSLALGIGANTAIVSLMDAVLWRELPVPNPQQLSLVNWQGHGFPQELADGASGSMSHDGGWNIADFFSYRSFEGMRTNIADKASLAAFSSPDEVSVSFEGRPLVAQLRPVSGSFFATLQTRPQLGRLLSASDDSYGAAPAAVLSHRFWASELGAEPGAIGRTIRINNKPHVIVGVAERGFYGLFASDATEIYATLHQAARHEPAMSLENDRYWGVQLLARRRPGVTETHLQAALDAVFPSTWSRQLKAGSEAPRIRLYPGGRGLGMLRADFRSPLLVLGGLVALLLVIACANIANLLLARANARQKELATRLSLGCSRARLMRQLLTESALLALLGGTASLSVAYASANLLGQFVAGRESIPISIALDTHILATVAAITAAALLVFGLFPAWQASRLPHAALLREGSGSLGTARRSKWSAGQLLVAGQMAMSVVLVMAGVIFTRNLMAIQSADPGFDRRNLILFGVQPGTTGYDKPRLQQFYFDLQQRMSATPGVAAAGIASMRPMNIGGWWDDVRLKGTHENNNVSMNGITPTYLALFTPRMVAGRNIRWADIASEAKVAVISEDLARKLGGLSVLGRTLVLGDRPPGMPEPEYEIVGIAPAIAATSMKERPYAVWMPFGKEQEKATVVLRTSQPPGAVLPMIRQTMNSIDRNLPMVDVITMEEQISKGLQRERMFATLCNTFGTLALVLSVVGLYGVMAYQTSRRRGEIGIRLALGAMPGDVVAMVLRDGMRLAALGLALGVPVVCLSAKFLEKELFQMKPLEPASLLLSLGVLLAAAVVAVGIPAMRASALPPAQAIRQE